MIKICRNSIAICLVFAAALFIGCAVDLVKLDEEVGTGDGTNPDDADTDINYDDWGAGECRQGDGNYSLQFFQWYEDLNPHTSGTNAEQALKRCEADCTRHADWCLAFEVTTRVEWEAPTCALITDLATFEGAGNTLQNDEWGGEQFIDGREYKTYCGGNGDCTHTNWDGGSFSPREGYHCSILSED